MTFDRTVTISDSLIISEISYSFKRRELQVTFATTGAVWLYSNVYPADFAKLVSAHSVGEVFNARFRNRYKETKVEASEES